LPLSLPLPSGYVQGAFSSLLLFIQLLDVSALSRTPAWWRNCRLPQPLGSPLHRHALPCPPTSSQLLPSSSLCSYCQADRSISRRMTLQAGQGKNERPYLNYNQSKKRVGDVAQVVECLPSKHEAPVPQKTEIVPPGLACGPHFIYF
jgi:hypothetical protein